MLNSDNHDSGSAAEIMKLIAGRLFMTIILLLVVMIPGGLSKASVKSGMNIYLPAVVKAFNQFVLEVEPNSTFETANTLSSSMAFRGYAGDDFDFILIDHFPSGPFMVTLENPAIEAQFDVFSSEIPPGGILTKPVWIKRGAESPAYRG